MKGTNVYSPFFKIRKTLVLLRWTFGFPLQAKDYSYTEFRFVLWLECLRFVIACLMPVACHVYWFIVLLVVDGNLENAISVLKAAYDTYSTNKIDQAFTLLLFINAVVMLFSYLLLFKYNTHAINSFCNEVTVLKSKLTFILFNKGDEVKHAQCMKLETSEKLILYGQIFNALASILFGISQYNLHKALTEDNILKQYGSNYLPLYFLMVTIQVLSTLFGPMSCAVEVLICQMINTLSDLFEDWNTLLQGKPRIHAIQHLSPQHVNITKYDIENGEM